MNGNPFVVISVALLLSACATPTVVSPTRTSDVRMSCHEIAGAIEEAERFEQEAREDRGVTGLNVAAAVFFWPALAGTYYNTEEAIEAAEARQRYLIAMYEYRECNA